MRQISKGLELERIARGVEKEHRRLLARLAREARVRFDHECDIVRLQPLGERLPFGGRQHDAEMRHGHVMPVDRIMRRPAARRIDAVRDDLVAVEIEVDPVGGAASFGTAENRSVEMARGIEVIDGKGDVKGGEVGHAPSFAAPAPLMPARDLGFEEGRATGAVAFYRHPGLRRDDEMVGYIC
ncbi:protein of unknown function [uncultured Sphingopyxis sp.]|uniref:Uncharacterized protein n=1 Tax=uncultured Sphingopyxis sp. TaxID=310581 RepID=A0A1Y5PWE4_9SPHN|nr:protein of unknown function [uncultured Sphingopyxis sp.]